MPASYSIDARLGVVFSRRWGVVTNEELIANARVLARDPRFRPTFRQLADLRHVESLAVTAAGIRELAQLNPFSKEARRAGVVGSDVSFGVLRMYQSSLSAGAEDILVAHTMAEALKWLGLDPSTPWPAESADFVSEGTETRRC